MKGRKYILLLAAVFCVHLLVTSLLLKKSILPKAHDERIRIVNFIRYESLLFDKKTELGRKMKALLTIKERDQGHPHLYEIVGALSWRIVRSFQKDSARDPLKLLSELNAAIVLTNSLFLLILLFSVYGIGSLCFSRFSGFIAAALTTLFPLVFGHTRLALLDFPLMCMVSLSIYLLLKTWGMESGFFAISWGISLVLSQLTKETAILFLAGPTLYYLVRSIVAGRDKKRMLYNIALPLVFFGIMSGCLFLLFTNRNVLLIYWKKVFIIDRTLNSLSYASAWPIKSIGWIILAVSVPLLASYLLRIHKRDKLFLVWILVPLAIFSLKSGKSARYLLPVLPAVALIVAGELEKISIPRWLRNTYASLVVTAALVQYTLIHYGILGLVGAAGNSCYSLERGMLTVFQDKFQPVTAKMFDIFQRESAGRSRVANILVLFNIGEIQGSLATYLSSFKMPFYVACYMQDDEPKVQLYDFDEGRWEQVVLSSDFVVDKEGWKGEYVSSKGARIEEILENSFYRNKNKFYLLGRITAPDDTTISIYKNKRKRK